MKFQSNKHGYERQKELHRWYYKHNIRGYKDKKRLCDKIRHLLRSKIETRLNRIYKTIPPEELLKLVRKKQEMKLGGN